MPLNVNCDFIANELNIEGDSEKWLNSLYLISQREFEGFDFISKQLDIPLNKINIYKAIIQSDVDTISTLFVKLKKEIPSSLLMMLFKAAKGDTKEIKDLILKRLISYYHKYIEFRLKWNQNS